MNITISLNANEECAIEIKPSKRAKYLRLKIDQQGYVQMVLPQGCPVKQAQAFAESKRAWIEKSLQSIRQQPITPITLPQRFTFPIVQESWAIDYQETPSGKLIYTTDADELSLSLSGKVNDQALVFGFFDFWLKERGKRCLPHMLAQVSKDTGLDYSRVTIRKQKTRWGSCSSKKSINLNCKLLFMPASVVRYVMVHELCHTQEMNHSKRFWALVEKHDPDYRHHEALLKQSRDYVPIGI